MPPFTLAVLDMAGTTIDEHGAVEQAARFAVQDVTDGRLPSDFDKQFNIQRGAAKIEIFRAIVGDKRAQPALDCFESELARLIRSGTVAPICGAEKAIAEFGDLGLKVALITGFSPPIRQLLLEQLGWGTLAHLVLSPEDVGRGRPYPDLILSAILRLQIDAVQQVVVVGDTINDMLAGTRAGAGLVAGVLTGAHNRRQLESAPHTHIVSSVAEAPALTQC